MGTLFSKPTKSAWGQGARWALLVQTGMILGFTYGIENSATAKVLRNSGDTWPLIAFTVMGFLVLLDWLAVWFCGKELWPRLSAVIWATWAALLLGQALVVATVAPYLWPLWGGYALLAYGGLDLARQISFRWSRDAN